MRGNLLSYKFPGRINCPKCGSRNTFIHDKGWIWFFRIISFNNRLVCRECHTTWKRLSPEKFSKLKRRSSSKTRRNNKSTYKLKMGETILEHTSTDGIVNTIAEWQENGETLICLDMQNYQILSTRKLSNLMNSQRRIRAIRGDLILTNVKEEVHDILWSLNLGYLVATNQIITP